MLMSEMTYAEIKDYLKNDSGLIIPVGTCEQHGLHLPINNDILGAEFLAGILSDRTGFLVAPTINYGVNLPCDRLLAGTTSITPETLRNTLLSITDWWRAQGFKKFVVITYHGDPFHLQALSELGDDIVLIKPWEIAYSDILEKQETMKHACEAETSIALYLYPQKVKMNLAKDSNIPFEIFEDYLFHKQTKEPDNYIGSLGFPTWATEEKGKRLVERMVDKMMGDFNDKIACN